MSMSNKIYRDSTGFTQISNNLLNNPEISFKAKGLYSFMYSKPDDWKFSIKRISLQAKESLDAIRSGLQELEKHGYLERIPCKEDGKFKGYDYRLTINGKGEKPSSENPTTENHVTLSNKELSNTDLSNKDSERDTSQTFLEKLEEEIQEIKSNPNYPILIQKYEAKNKEVKIEDEMKLCLTRYYETGKNSNKFTYFSSWVENLKTDFKKKSWSKPNSDYAYPEPYKEDYHFTTLPKNGKVEIADDYEQEPEKGNLDFKNLVNKMSI